MPIVYHPYQCVFLPLESTGQNITAVIGISYFTLTTSPKPRKFRNFYLKLGDLVVSISHCPEERLIDTYRHMLIALLLFPRYLNSVRLGAGHSILSDSDKAVMLRYINQSMKMGINFLMKKLLNYAALLPLCHVKRQLEISYSPDVFVMLNRIGFHFSELIASMTSSDIDLMKSRSLPMGFLPVYSIPNSYKLDCQQLNSSSFNSVAPSLETTTNSFSRKIGLINTFTAFFAHLSTFCISFVKEKYRMLKKCLIRS